MLVHLRGLQFELCAYKEIQTQKYGERGCQSIECVFGVPVYIPLVGIYLRDDDDAHNENNCEC